MGVVAAIASVVATGYSAYESNRQSNSIKKQAANAESRARQLQADEEKNRLQTAMLNQKRRGVAGEPGLRDTVLTGPLGLPSTQQVPGQKTLLGL